MYGYGANHNKLTDYPGENPGFFRAFPRHYGAFPGVMVGDREQGHTDRGRATGTGQQEQGDRNGATETGAGERHIFMRFAKIAKKTLQKHV